MQSYQNYKNEFAQNLESIGEIGYVQSVLPPIVYVKGLPEVHFGEVVYFESGEMGFVLSLSEFLCEVLVFSPEPVLIGTRLTRSGTALHIPVGEEYLGHSINPLGYSTAQSVYIPKPKKSMPIEQDAPGIDKRFKIKEPFETGVTVVDMMIPLGKGQRELVIGDRKTGKTEFLMQAMLTQAERGVICIYTGIGRKKNDIKRVEEFIKKTGLKDKFVVVSTSSTDPLGLIYITPYAAMTLAEYFVSIGKDVLLVLDDLSAHAKFYREISLIGKRFPGRNSYPGDMFYAHSRLLERAGNFVTPTGSNSITCLAAAETIESDISGYIQTNLMSITDGHIYFDHELFEQGRRPPVNYFLSVTRVGRQTQTKVRWGINRELSSFMTLYEKTQRFIHFGAEINDGIRITLGMGLRLLAFFDQPMGKVVHSHVQVYLFCLIWVGAIVDDNPTKIRLLSEKATLLYETDTSFRNKIDALIKDSSDFNILLGKVGAQSKDLLKPLEVALPKKYAQ